MTPSALPQVCSVTTFVAAFELGAEAAAVGAEHAGRVRLVDDQHAVVAVGDGDEIGERRAVAVHAVEAFDRDPRRARAARRAPVA